MWDVSAFRLSRLVRCVRLVSAVPGTLQAQFGQHTPVSLLVPRRGTLPGLRSPGHSDGNDGGLPALGEFRGVGEAGSW
jgi:hypothetical protein